MRKELVIKAVLFKNKHNGQYSISLPKKRLLKSGWFNADSTEIKLRLHAKDNPFKIKKTDTMGVIN